MTKKILIAPLNWGLGHASRIIPLIQHMKELHYEIRIASDGEALALLRKEFPGLYFYALEPLKISYSTWIPAWLKILLQIPKIRRHIRTDQKQIRPIINEFQPDLIISDNRYGFYHKSVKNVIITHQLNIQLPGILSLLSAGVRKMLRFQMRHFDQCWIPDFQDPDYNLSGNLSHGKALPENFHFIGPLSRFSLTENPSPYPEKWKIAAVLSGPEPQRSQLEKMLTKEFLSSPENILLVKGIPEGKTSLHAICETFFTTSFLTTDRLLQELQHAEVILCRSGYSSIMDLFYLRKKIVLIPTPGQTEQMYLARYHHHQKTMMCIKQKEFSYRKMMTEINRFAFRPFPREKTLQKESFTDLINNLIRQT